LLASKKNSKAKVKKTAVREKSESEK